MTNITPATRANNSLNKIEKLAGDADTAIEKLHNLNRDTILALKVERERVEKLESENEKLTARLDEQAAPATDDDGPREPGTRPDTATAGQLYTAQIRASNGEFSSERGYIVMCVELPDSDRKVWQVCSPSNRKLYTVPDDGVLINALIDPWVALSRMSKPPYAPEDNEEDS